MPIIIKLILKRLMNKISNDQNKSPIYNATKDVKSKKESEAEIEYIDYEEIE
tara:strand:- start:1488 stop:1643 length:156 start_codon:yes stop_codon:yes gene_type:complete